MSNQSIAAQVAEMDAWIAARVSGVDVTRGELRVAFDKVADKANWKNPIDARVNLPTAHDVAVMREAVAFFAGCRPTITPVGSLGRTKLYRVEADGYYATVGA